MVAVGVGGALLSLPFRRRLFMLAACCVFLTGAISFWRRIAFLAKSFFAGAGCP
jgi:hypothetical protein